MICRLALKKNIDSYNHMVDDEITEGQIGLFTERTYSQNFRSCLFLAAYTPETSGFVMAHARPITDDEKSSLFLRGRFSERARRFLLEDRIHLGNVVKRALRLLPETEYIKIIAATQDTLDPVLVTIPNRVMTDFRIVSKDQKTIYFENGRARIEYTTGRRKGQTEMF